MHAWARLTRMGAFGRVRSGPSPPGESLGSSPPNRRHAHRCGLRDARPARGSPRRGRRLADVKAHPHAELGALHHG